jgi:hypothetical protein
LESFIAGLDSRLRGNDDKYRRDCLANGTSTENWGDEVGEKQLVLVCRKGLWRHHFGEGDAWLGELLDYKF